MEHLPVIRFIYPSCCHITPQEGLDCNSRYSVCNSASDTLAQATVICRKRSCSVGGRDFPAPDNGYICLLYTSLHEKYASLAHISCLQGMLVGLLVIHDKTAPFAISLSIPSQK
ncbi:hypothetical protein AVEN_65299-1 [Araneus ventricosus]|uniref:Uncharacterized protein n=1 Tax=Araneus ventricosus TaxID=182803 RepID=A0A4Y2AG90_ARAVE|nr:hypothetical protein AVEN_65299-1 [Araneus ventricosus]